MTAVPRRTHADAVAAAITDPGTLARAQIAVPVPPELSGWLHALALLTTVPLHHLVPDPEAVPPESIRFFSVDPNWVTALLDGACSVGRSSSADLQLDIALAGPLRAAAGVTGPLTGFLLRSAVVDGWPGLEVAAQDAHGAVLDRVLRRERLAPGLLVYLVEGVLASVEIHEPAEGLHFGLDPGLERKQLRHLRASAHAVPGTLFPGVAAQVHFRDRGLRVLDVAATADSIGAALPGDELPGDELPGTGEPPSVNTAEFALQMVEGAQSVRFTVDGPG
jgi:hypothetical protein